MSVTTNPEKVQFWRKWTLRNAIALVLGYIIAFSIAIVITIIGDLNTSEWGPPFTQICWKIGEGVIIGLSIGFIQLRLLRKIFNVSSFWLYSIVIGFIIVELIAGITCWRMEINRGDLSFLEGDPLGHR